MMLTTFNALKEIYGSREISMDDLEVLQRYDFIRFENLGISRSNRDCLLCEVECEPFAAFLKHATATVFESPAALRETIRRTGLGLHEAPCDDASLLCFKSDDEGVEIIAGVDPEGQVSITPDDVEVLPFFQVFLRVQH
jgi:hypothetical protein